MTKSEAIEHLKNIAIYSVQDGYTDEARQALDMAIKALEEPERKKGKWILDTFQIRCSQCNKLFSDNLFTSKYCPNCGARMDGESE